MQLQTYLLRLVVNFYLNIDTLAIRSRSLHITRDRAVTFVEKKTFTFPRLHMQWQWLILYPHNFLY